MAIYEPMLISEIIKEAADAAKFIAESEMAYENEIKKVANQIAQNAEQRPFVLISGPSGSGKTTSAMKLKEKLDKMGFETHVLSLDNYFRPITDAERPLFNSHKIDLESPDRMDCDLLNSQLQDIINGKEVETPYFDFVTNTRKKSGRHIKLHKGELIILEGIHSLNPKVIENSDDFSSKLYVSVRSRIEHSKKGESFLLHPSKIRLARRIIRDGRTRNRGPSDVVALYDSVELGENRYIMPYKHRSDYDIDTFIPYELCVYKSHLPSSLPNDEIKHPWLTELFEVIAELPTISSELVPYESLTREFIGNGKYE